MKTPLRLTAFLLLASAIAVLFSTSCRTVHGFGRDVEAVGDNIEHAAH